MNASSASERVTQPTQPQAGSVETDTCAKLCDITRTLACPGDQPAQCIEACAQMHDSEACTAEMRAFLRCAAEHDASHWECGEDGESALRGEECEAEQREIVLCLANIDA